MLKIVVIDADAEKWCRENTFADKDNSVFSIAEILSPSENPCKKISECDPDMIVMTEENNQTNTIVLFREIKRTFSGIPIVIEGTHSSYEAVRNYFVEGAFDYLLEPMQENMFLSVLSRYSDTYSVNRFLADIEMDIEELIRRLFLGDETTESLSNEILEKIYASWNGGGMKGQIAAEKIKAEIYSKLITRKPWLEKFLYKNDFVVPGLTVKKTKKEVCDEWKKCFHEVSAIVKKYQMIDSDRRAYRIGKYVVVHVDDLLTLDLVADEVAMNASYVSYVFKKATDMNLFDYMLEVKVDRAKILLRDPSMRIADVAQKIGYANPEYFSKCFRKNTGITPTNYRRQICGIRA